MFYNFRSVNENCAVKFDIPRRGLTRSFTVKHQSVHQENNVKPLFIEKPAISSKPNISQKPTIKKKPTTLQKLELKPTPPPTPPPKPPRKSIFLKKIIKQAVEKVIEPITEKLELQKHNETEEIAITIEFNDSSDSFDSWDEDDDDEKEVKRYSITPSLDLSDEPLSENVILHVEKLYKHNPARLPSKNNVIKTCRIIQELIDNEKCYITSLKQGIDNYIKNFESGLLPNDLKGQKRNLFSNIEAIYEFHVTKFFPKLLECDFDPMRIANTFTSLIDGYQFDIYVIYVLNWKKSEILLKANEHYFKQLQKDRLGISSFLIQPIQRLPRYQLLLAEVIKNLMKDLDNQKPAIQACCIAEKHIQRLLNTVNEHC